MKKVYPKNVLMPFFILAIVIAVLLYNCQGTSPKLVRVTYDVSVTDNPGVIAPGGSSKVSAQVDKVKVYDDSSKTTTAVADGEIVVFTVDKTDCGSLNPGSAKTVKGIATSTYTATGPKAGSGCELIITGTFQGQYSDTTQLIVKK
jgi:hypothetical protein